MISTRPTRFPRRPSLSRVSAGLERGAPQGHAVEQGRLPGGSSRVLEPRGLHMADTQTVLFDGREHELPPPHRLTLVPHYGKSVTGTCSCGRIFEGHSSDAVSDSFNGSTCNR